jgi:hypothetical protein
MFTKQESFGAYFYFRNYTVYREHEVSMNPKGFVVQLDNNYLVDGELVGRFDWDHDVYRSIDDAMRAIANLESTLDHETIGTESGYPGFRSSYSVLEWTRSEFGSAGCGTEIRDFPKRYADPEKIVRHPRGMFPLRKWK